MRRVSAVVLVALFGFSLINPAVFVPDRDSKLPACCRRSGKHHCEMMATQSAPYSGPALEAGVCSLFWQTKTVAAGPTSCFAVVLPNNWDSLVSQGMPAARADILRRTLYTRAGSERGPPLTIA